MITVKELVDALRPSLPPGTSDKAKKEIYAELDQIFLDELQKEINREVVSQITKTAKKDL